MCVFEAIHSIYTNWVLCLNFFDCCNEEDTLPAISEWNHDFFINVYFIKKVLLKKIIVQQFIIRLKDMEKQITILSNLLMFFSITENIKNL